jgi:beta-galactosidase
MLQGGMIPGVFETANFGSKPIESFQKLEEYQPDQPYMCMEFWNGWFDHWREPHHTRDASDVAQVLDNMLQTGASVNFYMFHGGTNFGFYNGANHSDKYEPTITSYDYDSLLDEAGRPTKKYFAVQEVLAKYNEVDLKLMPEERPVMSLGPVSLTKQVSLFDCLHQLSTPVQTACPEPMEVLGQDYGFILYTTDVSGPREETELVLQEVHDRALIFLDGEYKGVIERWNKDTSIKLTIPKEGAKLSIFVENMGRINYGPQLKDYKGITEGVRLERQFLFNWTIHSLPLDDLSKLTIDSDIVETKGPEFYKGTFEVEECADTFLELKGWTKGVVYVNGFNLGRYWEAGPQQTLYVPAPLLKEGENELVIFELHETKDPTVLFLDEPNLG